jgi:AcrR family transcriptional regulator
VDQRRQALVEAAFRTIARLGIRRATTRAICTEAGMQQGVFHYCFRSKQELYRELIRVMVVDMVDAAVTVPDFDHDPEQCIRRSLSRVWQHATAYPDRQLAAYELTTYMLRDKDLSDLPAWQYRQYVEQGERLAQAIEAATGTGWAVPRPVLARMLSSGMDGLVLSWLTDRDNETAEAALDAFSTAVVALSTPATRK